MRTTQVTDVRSLWLIRCVCGTSRRLIDGERTDERFVDGLTKIYNLLENSSDIELVTRYGLWLVLRDRELGLRLFTRPAAGVQFDVGYILAQLKAADGVSADRYLEHIVFTRKNLVRSPFFLCALPSNVKSADG